ncbi:MAG: hypothetical protein AAF514_19130, partial [Verrucomicrobiota bacterium]
RRRDLDGASLHLETSTDLQSWEDAETAFDLESTTPTDRIERVALISREPVTTGGGARFYRLRATAD